MSSQRVRYFSHINTVRAFIFESSSTWHLAEVTLWSLSTVWVKPSPPQKIFWHFLSNGWEFLVQILHAYYTFLSMLDYKFLFSYLQLWRSYAIIRPTTIMCSKCPPSTEMHYAWSHLIWRNFVKGGDNWIKISILVSDVRIFEISNLIE